MNFKGLMGLQIKKNWTSFLVEETKDIVWTCKREHLRVLEAVKRQGNRVLKAYANLFVYNDKTDRGP